MSGVSVALGLVLVLFFLKGLVEIVFLMVKLGFSVAAGVGWGGVWEVLAADQHLSVVEHELFVQFG